VPPLTDPNSQANEEQGYLSPQLLDARRVADILRCSTRHVRRLADAGKMPQPVKLGTLIRWRRLEIEKWIAGGCLPLESRGR
jgi:excisionase family DNA binding protein